MGTGISYQTSISNNEYLQKFVQKDPILINDTFWSKFLSFSFRPPITPNENATLDEKIQPICQLIMQNNFESGNLGALIQVYLTKSAELVKSSYTNNSMFCWQTYNALFIIRCITKYLVENVKEEDVIRHYAAKPKATANNDHLQKIEEFIDSLIDILVDLPNKDFTYPIHLEAINCLIILLSIHLFSQRPASNSFIYRSLIQGKYSIHAPKLMKVLLQHVADYEKAPPGLHPSNGGGSIMLGIASEIWNMLTLGMARNSSNHHEQIEVPVCIDTPLAGHSLLLILILTNHCTAENPYRESLFSCTNSSADRTAPQPGGPTFKIDFAKLYTTMSRIATLEHGTLLLYLLLHRNPHFKNFVMSRSDIENLVVPILKTLYHAPDSNSHHIYMSLIILLVLSEDNLFNKTVHETMLKGVTWYTERSISEISLGGLLVLIVIRTIQYNMLKMRDKYLHTNCLAALANMSGQFRSLHPYVSQRLVSLFETLAKKHVRLSEQMKQQTAVINIENVAANHEEGENAEIVEDISVLEEVLRMILEILNSCLSNQLSHNPNLVYTLLYKKQIFEPYRSHPAFQDIMQNIDIVILYFSNKLDQIQDDLGVNEVLSTIQLGALQWPKERLSRFPDLKFKYVEEDQPEDFFIPYVWTLVCSCSSLYWNPSKIKLFVAEAV